jgi:hypothetical protein
VASDEVHPDVIEVAMTRFSSEDLAEKFWARRPGLIKTLEKLDPSLQSSFSNSALVLQWSRGSVTFTEIAHRSGPCILGAVAADESPKDHEPLLNSVLAQVRTDALPADRRTSVPLPVRKIIRAAVLVGIFFALVELLQLVLPSGLDAPAAIVVLVLVLVVMFWPYVFGRLAFKRSVRQGDADGAIRRALASRGIALPG